MKKSSILAGMMILSGAVSAAAAEPAVNFFCPVLTDQKADATITTTYKGKTVAFCCDRCRTTFKADPDKYVGRPAQFAHADTPGDRHDHAAAVGNAEDQAERPIPFPGRLHPVIVHFPVAGIPLAILGFLVWRLTGRDAFAKADVPALLAATAAAVAAVITGEIRHDAMQFSETMHEIVEHHEHAAIMVMIICLVLVALRVWRWSRMTGAWLWIYAGGLIVATILVGLTGYLGGTLVYGPDHFKW